jgi:hypothetical protein
MTLPAALLGFLISSLYGALFHLIRDGKAGRLLLCLSLAWIGFVIGHILGAWRGWVFLMAGPLNLGMGTLGSLILLGLGDWLGRIEAGSQSKV